MNILSLYLTMHVYDGTWCTYKKERLPTSFTIFSHPREIFITCSLLKKKTEWSLSHFLDLKSHFWHICSTGMASIIFSTLERVCMIGFGLSSHMIILNVDYLTGKMGVPWHYMFCITYCCFWVSLPGRLPVLTHKKYVGFPITK